MSERVPARDNSVDSSPDSLRKAALQRAGFATIALLLLLAAALWLPDTDEVTQPPSVPVAVSPQDDSQAAVEASPPATLSLPASDPVAPQAEAAAAPPDPPMLTWVPGGTVSSVSPATAQPAPATTEPTEPATTAQVPAPDVPGNPATVTSSIAPAPAAEPSVPKLPASPPPGPGYLVQLGVFLDTENAEGLRRELARKGYPAHLQSRVVLGPFPDRQAALAAQEKVRRERKLDGIILQPRKP
ncbi:SPOR domain-containing protein [Aromatoleum diolicum]|uniref:SPOR domain-containing protein n=1 Tax=Aromatoleum diolicum TaxID=75796 RepID=A0ABX1Q9Q1_9RHOO|nr:SPOR domain-containing protein [Aromatoleum diolicum]NMG74270.1 hypothetical protein [Aromatoleum diolicum]